MAAGKRVVDEPAYVLHRYDWSESSLILDVFTRHHGRVALVARGAKRPTSNFRPVLLPLQPLRLTYGQSARAAARSARAAGDDAEADSDLQPLKGAEWVGGHVMPTGEALLSGYYLNELLMRMLARDDPHARLFDVYALAVRLLATGEAEALQPALRSFELLLLRETGFLPALDAETATLAPLRPELRYALSAEHGLRRAGAGERASLSGAAWAALHAALADADEGAAPGTAALQAVLPWAAELKAQLRGLLQYHIGTQTLRTRQVMMDLQSL
ncbi:MAG: recombination protein O N-terminal domain-containing protein [Xylophilus ampelinus]